VGGGRGGEGRGAGAEAGGGGVYVCTLRAESLSHMACVSGYAHQHASKDVSSGKSTDEGVAVESGGFVG